jgi:DNA-binding CsgD family transcriptional regulator
MFGLRAAADIAVRARARRDEAAARAAVAAAEALMVRYSAAIASIEEPDRLSTGETAWVEELLRAELARAAGRDDPAAWAAIRPALRARPTPYLEAYVMWRQADATPPSMGSAAVEALAAAHAIAVTIGAPLLAARVEAIARRRRLDLGRASGAAGGDAASDGASAEAPAPADPFGLTAREREILALLAEGYTNRRLAESLFISESTAGVHVSNILGKLGVSSRTEAATLAVRLGLDTAAPPDTRPDDPQIRR